MRKLILSAAFAGLLMSAPAFAATTLTPDQIAVGIGKWRWSEAESNYSTGAYARSPGTTRPASRCLRQ